VADAEARIRVVLDNAQAMAQLKALEKQLSYVSRSIVQGSSEAAKIQKDFTTSLLHNINATGQFSASMGKVMTETERFTNALETNKMSAREYFRFSMASTKTFGKMFGREFSTITKVAEDRVKLLQTRHIELGRSADGAMRAIKVVPESIDYSKPLAQMQLAAQRQQIFNQLLDTGTTKLLNFGKNTQWAGRQLMVGFTIPLSILGGVALRTFKEMEGQAIRFKKVYGDMFTGEAETQRALESIQALGKEFTKYGVTVADTLKLAADAAAAGNAGKELENIVEQTTRLSVLGDLPAEKAFDATIAIQNAFRTTGVELTNTINFLNAVENQTVVALEDITEAIPRVASVISVLGGDVKDLAFFMAAMKEGGVQAADGANALKTSLGRLINPTKAAVNTAADLGINLKAIVDENAGDLRTIMLTFAEALKPLDDLSKARLMEKVFGKFQFARMSTLFDNLARSGSQASRVMELAGQSTEELAMLAEKELGVVADSAATKLAASMEQLRVSLVPIGEAFAKAITPIVEFITRILEKFNEFSDGTKRIITIVVAAIGGIGPILLMSIGLIANGIANILKFINLLRKGYQSLSVGGQSLGLSTSYLSQEQLESLSVANNLYMSHERLTDQYALEAQALMRLTGIYQQGTAAMSRFAGANPAFFRAGAASNISRFGNAPRFADGGWVPGTGNKDTVPAVLMPGEFVVRKDAAQSNKSLLENMNNGGGTYRGMGTPAFGKMQYRADGTGGQSSNSARNITGIAQTSGLHLRTTTPAGSDGRKRYAGYAILGTQSFNQLTTQDESIRRMLGSASAEGYPMYRNEARSIANQLESIPKAQRSLQQEVSLRTLKAELGQYPTGKHWRNEMARRYGLSALASEGLDPRSQQGKNLMSTLEKEFRQASAGSKNTDQLTKNLYQRADKLWERGILSDAGRRGGKYLGMPITKLLSIINDPNLARTQGGYGLTIPKFLKPKFDSAGQLVSILGEPVKQTSSQTMKTTRPNVAKTIARRPSARFGAALGLATVVGSPAIASALGLRAGGTPAYGEQGVTPALLTPGEFVVNSKATQQFGPELQSMNSGGIARRIEGTPNSGPLTRDNMRQRGLQAIYSQGAKMQAEANKQAVGSTRTFGSALNTLTAATKKATGMVDQYRYGQQGLTNLEKQKQQEIRRQIKEDRRITTQANRAKFQQVAGRASGIGFAVSGAAMVAGMAMPEGKSKDMMSNVANIGFAVSGIAMLLPMLTNPLVLGAAAAAGIAGSMMLYNKLMKKAADEGYKSAQALGVTADELKKVSESTGRVGLSQIGERVRENRLRQFTPVESDFGSEFIDSDAGKTLLDQAKEFEKSGLNAAELIGRKLATYVADGLMDAAQAESVSAELGRQFGSTTFGIKVSGELQSLIGFNGIDVTKDPMLIRVKLVEETQAATSELIGSTQKDLENVMQGGAFYAVDQAREAGEGLGGIFKAAITSVFKPKLLQNELAGAIAGSSDLNLEFTQQQIDAGNIQYMQKKDQLSEMEKLLNAELAAANTSDRRKKIEEELAILQEQRAFNEESYSENSQKLLNIQASQFTNLRDSFRDSVASQDAMLSAVSSRVKEQFKGTPLEGVAAEFLKTTEGFEDKSLTYTINTLVTSQQLDIVNAQKLLEMFSDEKELSFRVDTMVETQGLEAVNRTLTALSKIEDSEQASRLFTDISNLSKENFDSANMFLEIASGIPDAFMDLNDKTAELLDPKMMAEAGNDIKKIEEQLSDLSKYTGEERTQFIMEFISNDSDFAQLKGQAEYFAGLEDSQVKEFLTIYRTMLLDFDPEQATQQLQQSGASQMLLDSLTGSDVGSQNRLFEWWANNVALPNAKNFIRIMKDLNIPELSEVDPDGTGSKQTEVYTEQLIALRLKGLSPAAAASVDYETATRILNASLSKQRQAIAALNKEVRLAAIRSEVLKSEEERLNDVLKANVDAIGAYIDSINEIRIKPIQDQIDNFNKLSEAQQDQIEKYQRGLQKLSEKEDNINKIYDERIDAIDKVSQANERSAQRQQRQIDLASAIASGDFAAAAGAAADISSSEAAYQLEDARSALENARQEELKNLTIEINGQLYTREQIENNIKNIEEEIYQRSLLIRAEQEKIAAIEREITAEKEKQRKLQTLIQISQLSQQMQTTPNQVVRQAMAAQIGFLGQSIGMDPSDPSSVAAFGDSVGINVSAISTSLLQAQQWAELTNKEFEAKFKEGVKLAGNISGSYSQASAEAKMSLGFIQGVKNLWAGNKKTGTPGMVETGTSILSNLQGVAESISIGKKQIDNQLSGALKAIANARKPFNKGGMVTGYMGGGKVKKYAMGGNVNYKGSNEPAPVRMSMGSIVPGLGNIDRVPALLTPGEFVVRKSVAQENMGFLKALNGNVFPKMSSGISAPTPTVETSTVIQSGPTLYNNYSVNVNVADTNASAEDIAGVVMNKIKSINDRGMRGNRF
jgi:TP901 family phage tail tape measure protein